MSVAAELQPDVDGEHLVMHGHAKGKRGWALVGLSYGALGVIYGDIATSPLYSYQAVFKAAPSEAEVLSAASLFFWTLTLIVLIKYVGIVLRFDDNGEGGTFALYSLICRAAGFGPYGPTPPTDIPITNKLFGLLPESLAQGHFWSVQRHASSSIVLRDWYRRSRAAQVSLLVTVMLATAMVVGDGVLTPSISVMSAISGLQVATDVIQQPQVVGITIAVLVILFSVQRLGTGKISVVFAPVVLVWLLFNAALGLFNLSTCGWQIWQAISPHHAILAFMGAGGFKVGWQLLSGVMLCITGAEAMYADLGHFNAEAVTLSFCVCVYPCLVVTYMGQAAYLLAHPAAYTDPFWLSVPSGAFIPMLIVATATSIVASQALISGVFSIMRQAMMLGVLPRLRITHTDAGSEGQIYIQQINFMLLLGCVAMVAGFQDTTALGHAYGVAVMSVMLMTSILSAIVMTVCYNINPMLVGLFAIIVVPLEGLFLSSAAEKIPEGGWVTIMIAVLVASIKLVWWYGSSQKSRRLRSIALKNRELLKQQHHEDLVAADEHDQWPQPTEERQHLIASAVGRADRSLSHTSTPVLHSTHKVSGGSGSLHSCSVNADSGVLSKSRPKSVASMSAPTAAAQGRSPSPSGGLQMTYADNVLARLPGLGIIYTEATAGLPAVLQHLLINMPALHRVVVLLTLRFIPLPYVDQQQRFLVRRSSDLPGLYRVIARYGYMEEVEHGPGFVRQLVGCLVKHVAQAHEPLQQGNQASAPAAPSSPAAAPAPAGTTIEVVVEGAVAEGPAEASRQQQGHTEPQGLQLQRWSSVPPPRADKDMLSAAAGAAAAAVAAASSAGPASPAGTNAHTCGGASSPRSLLPKDADRAANADVGSDGVGMLGSRRLSGDLAHSIGRQRLMSSLGRESINRHQYRQQRQAAVTGAAAEGSSMWGRTTPEPAAGAGGGAAAASGGAVGLTVVPAVMHDAFGSGDDGSGNMFGADAHLAVSADGLAAASPQLEPLQEVAAGSGSVSLLPAVPPAAARATRLKLSSQQLQEISLLLGCYRHRAVYVVGHSHLAAQAGAKGVLAWGSGLLLGFYRFIAHNTQPATSAWKLPDNQLLEVKLLVRV